MKSRSRGLLPKALLFSFGIDPTMIVAISVGALGGWTGVIALSKGDPGVAPLIAWLGAGVFGLISLVSTSTRFEEPGFELRRWEISGLILGPLACIPFPAFFAHAARTPGVSFITASASLSALSALVLLAYGLAKGGNPSNPSPDGPTRPGTPPAAH
jgi:hypothetical protein